jgi:hypothetical protein
MQARPGTKAVGWYVSHTRTGLGLGPGDLEIFDGFFARLGSVALVIKPAHLGPAEAAFFYRGGDGAIHSGESFEIEAAPRLKSPEPAAEEAHAPVDALESEASAEYEPAREPDPPQPVVARPRFRWRWLAAAAAVLAIAAAFFVWRPRPPARLQLSAQEISAGQVRIEWDRAAASALGATSGVLEIEDGDSRLRVPLDSDQLRNSSITYAHRSPRVAFRLLVQRARGGALEERLSYAGKAPPPAAAPSPMTPAPVQPAKDVEPRSASAAPAPAQRVTVEPAAPRTEPAERASAERAGNPAPEPGPLRKKIAIIPAAPASQPRPANSLPSPPAVTPGPPAQAVSLPLNACIPAPAPPPARTTAYAGPRSGRLIWTGTLTRRGVVEIEGSHASVGTLGGALPGVPVSLRVSPAAFSSEGGLVIYSSDAARNSKSEPAGAGNGWNGARFEWDPERARELTLLETPNPSNQFKRLALRNDARTCSVIIIDWTVQ